MSPAPRKYDLDGQPVAAQAQKYDLNGKLIAPSASQVSTSNPVISGTEKAAKFLSGAPEKSLAEGGSWSDILPALGTTVGSFVPGGLATRILAPAAGAALGTLGRAGAQHDLHLEDVEDAFGAGVGTAALGTAVEGAKGLLPAAIKQRQLERIGKAHGQMSAGRQALTGYNLPNVSSAEDVLGAKVQPIRADENAAWQDVRKHAEANTQTFTIKIGEEPSKVINPATGQSVGMVPIFEDRNIVGPIKLNGETKNFLDTTGKAITDLYSQLNDEGKGKISKLYNTLKTIQTQTALTNQGEQIIPFELAKELRSNIGEITAAEKLGNLRSNVKSVGNTRQGGALGGLRETLTNDITDSMAGQWKSGADAASRFAEANDLTKTRVKASIFDKIWHESIDEGSGKLNVNGMIDKIKNPTSDQTNIFSAQERNQIERTIRAVARVSPDFGGSFTYDNGAFIVRNIFRAANNPIGLSVGIAAREVAEKLMLNPKYARVLSEMPSLPANSARAQFLGKTVLAGLKGASVYVLTPSGTKIQAHIDDQGKPVPDNLR